MTCGMLFGGLLPMPSEGNLNLDLKVCENCLSAFHLYSWLSKPENKKAKFPTVTDSELETLVFASQNWMLLNQLDQKTKTRKTFWVDNRASSRSWWWNPLRPLIKWHNMRFNERSIASRGTTEINRAVLGCLNHAIEGLPKTGELRGVIDIEKVLLIWSESSDFCESFFSNYRKLTLIFSRFCLVHLHVVFFIHRFHPLSHVLWRPVEGLNCGRFSNIHVGYIV